MQLLSILWQKYRAILLVLIVLVCGISVLEASSNINEWDKANTFMKSKQFKESYAKDASKYIDVDKKSKGVSYEKFVKHSNQFWLDDNYTSYLSKDYHRNKPTDTLEISIGLTLFVVFFLLMSDTTRHFNSFLLGSKNTRLKIIMGKYIMLVLVPLLIILSGEGLYYMLINLFIPDQYLNWGVGIDWGQISIELILLLLLTALIFITATIIGSAIWSFILLIGLLFSLISTTPLAIEFLYNSLIRKFFGTKMLRVDDLFINQFSLVLIIFTTIILFAIEVRLFKKFSAEYEGQFVMKARLKWPLWWTTLVYTTFSIGFGIIPTLVDNSSSNESIQGISCLGLLLIINLVMYVQIFKPKSFKHPIKSIQ